MSPPDSTMTAELEAATLISGPHTLFNSTFILEFLDPPPSLNATVLMRCTYLLPGMSQGKTHPQAPPLHLHFSQSESFLVTKGTVGTTMGWDVQDSAWTRANTPHEIAPWVPHRFWPHPEAGEDTVLYLWAHPEGGDERMDRLFFENVLVYVSDAHEGKVKLDLVQMLVTQHASASALIMFPTAWWLGPLRWWMPWVLQAGVAMVGRWAGYRALMERYVGKEQWEESVRAKRL